LLQNVFLFCVLKGSNKILKITILTSYTAQKK
jgi:hypothetical protein